MNASWPHALRTSLLLVLLACAAINLARYSARDYESECTKHYYSDATLYGGWSSAYVETSEGPQFKCQSESHHWLRNFASFLDDGNAGARPSYLILSEGPGRLLAGSFLPGLLMRLCVGQISYVAAYFLTNLLLWGLSTWCVYRLAQEYFPDSAAPLLAVIFMVCYPVFPLMLNSIKVQYAGVPFMLLGLYVHEIKLREASARRRFLFFFSYGILGMLSAMGTLYLFAALLGLAVPRAIRERRWVAAASLAGLVAGALASEPIFRLLKISSKGAYQHHHVGALVSESAHFLWNMLTGQDTASLKILNMSGDDFCRLFVPCQFGGMFEQNPAICCLAVVALLFMPAARKFGLAALLLFLPAQTPTILTGWASYHYGYCSAPVMIMLFFASAGLLGKLLSQELRAFRLAGLALFCLILASFQWNDKRALTNYFGDCGFYPAGRSTFVYHGNDCTEY